MTFKDHFSERAQAYAQARPTYPPALFTALAALAPGWELAWDVGTGNGQAARGLAEHFERVLATDASAKQLAEAASHPHIVYRQANETASGLRDRSADLVTVAQAAHWFDLPAFYAEALRVLRPGGVLAMWAYGLAMITPPIDDIVERFYRETVGRYWPPERRHIETGYRDLPFPLPDLPFPPLAMEHRWTLGELLGYISTWSAVSGYRKETGADPIPALETELRAAWGDPDRRHLVRWPLVGRIGRTAASGGRVSRQMTSPG